jgi:hypothetical protein
MNSWPGKALQKYQETEQIILRMRSLLLQEENFRFLDSPAQEIYPFCTPLIISRKTHEEITRLVELFSSALEQIGAQLAANRKLARRVLQFSSALEEEFFFLDHGFGKRLPIRRLDMAMDSKGESLLMEINCGCPGGELDPALVAKAYWGAANCLEQQGLFLDPRDESLKILLECYRDFSRTRPWMPQKPTIALLSSQAQARFMLPECRGIAAHYRSKGYRVLVGNLEDLEANSSSLLLGGEPVHLVFRKFSTQSLRLRLEKQSGYNSREIFGAKQLWEALCAQRVCLVNPLGSTLLQDKGLLGLIWETQPHLRRHLPESFVLGPGLKAKDPDLFQCILTGESFVLKKRASYGGRHVILDPDAIKREAVRLVEEEPDKWVAQKRVVPTRKKFLAWDGRNVRKGRFPFVLSPFGRSAFVRVGLEAAGACPINAHGGSATTFVMLES